jgi:hypothetical protein
MPYCHDCQFINGCKDKCRNAVHLAVMLQGDLDAERRRAKSEIAKLTEELELVTKQRDDISRECEEWIDSHNNLQRSTAKQIVELQMEISDLNATIRTLAKMVK